MNKDASTVEDVDIHQMMERLLMSCIGSSGEPFSIFRKSIVHFLKNGRDLKEKFDSAAMSESISSSSMTSLSESWVNCCPPTGLTVLASNISPDFHS